MRGTSLDTGFQGWKTRGVGGEKRVGRGIWLRLLRGISYFRLKGRYFDLVDYDIVDF